MAPHRLVWREGGGEEIYPGAVLRLSLRWRQEHVLEG